MLPRRFLVKSNPYHLGHGPGGGQFTTEELDGQTANAEGVTPNDRKNPRFKGMTDTRIKKQKFVDAHLSVTEKAAGEINVPVANILGATALESGWGLGDFINDGPTQAESTNGYFGMVAPEPFSNGTTEAANSKQRVASFASYEDALNAFVATKGNLVRNVSDPTKFATIMQLKGKFGVDVDTGKFDPEYISNLVGTIKKLDPIIQYTKRNPL